MSIQEARSILKNTSSNWTDEQVQSFITDMGIVCDDLIELSIKVLTKKKESEIKD